MATIKKQLLTIAMLSLMLIGLCACNILGAGGNPRPSDWQDPSAGIITDPIEVTPPAEPFEVLLMFYQGSEEDVTLRRTVMSGSLLTGLTRPERTGYAFLYWKDLLNGFVAVENARVPWVGEIRLFAVYEPNVYTVYFDDNYTGGSIVPRTVVFGEAFENYVPTRAGFTFAGWYKERDCTTQVYSDRGYSTPYDTTYYAKWNQTYTLTFVNDGSSAIPSRPLIYGQGLTAIPAVTARTGYTLIGFYSEPDGKGAKWYATDNNLKSNPQTTQTIWGQDVTLYAYWKPFTYTVTLSNGNAGSRTITATYGKPLPYTEKPLYETIVLRDYYDFLGYFDTQNATGGVQYYDADMNGVAVWNRTATVVLYARWKGISCEVTLDGIAGTQTIYYGESYTLPVPVRTGYDFRGWYGVATEENPTPADYTGANGTSVAGAWNRPFSSAFTLTARWQARSYNVFLNSKGVDIVNPVVSFDLNAPYGTTYTGAQIPAQTVTHVNPLTYPAVPATWGSNTNYYIFAGWYTSPTDFSGAPYDFNTPVTSNLTLYARWQNVVYNIGHEIAMSNAIAVNVPKSDYGGGSSVRYYSFVPLVTGRVNISVVGTGQGSVSGAQTAIYLGSTGYINGSALTPVSNMYYNLIAGTLYYLRVGNIGAQVQYQVRILPEGNTFNGQHVPSYGSGKNPAFTMVSATFDAMLPTQYYNSNSPIPVTLTPPLATQLGQVFDGYYSQPNGQGTQYYNQAMTPVHLWDVDQNNVVLYANWI